MRKIVSIGMLFVLFCSIAQSQNFTVSPEKPKPGDVLTITYEPAGDIANTLKPVEALYNMFLGTKNKTDDITMTKTGSKYQFTLATDTGALFVYFGFSADGKYDNNFNNGYWVQLYDGDKVRKGSNLKLAIFYQGYGPQVGVERNNEKALNAMDKEFALYPDNLKSNASNYYRLLGRVKKDAAPAIIQKAIENKLKEGLKSEDDYTQLNQLYLAANLQQQALFIADIRKDKYPKGKWKIDEVINSIYEATDIKETEKIYQEIESNIKSNPDWASEKENLSFYQYVLASGYIKNKRYDEFKKIAEAQTDKAMQAQLYNSAAWEMQKANDNLQEAAAFAEIATSVTKKEWVSSSTPKPDYMTTKNWNKNKEFMYAMYADTYGMVEFKRGNYKKGLTYAKEAAITINKGKDADQNTTYSLLAEKVLPAKQLKKEMEQFVKDGKASGEMKNILQRLYVKEKGSDAGFDDYVAVLQKENYTRMLAELRKSMLSETAPSFALLDMSGKKLDIADLKGKVVVVDFWATWCGPCKASFPGMQKMVNKYKDNQNVKFIFVDTWEKGEEKEKNASEFITSNKYSFHVLMDNEDKVVTQFKVEGIPTKFIIDKNGVIRFKAVGFDGNDEKLAQELTAMIEMAETESTKKTF